MKSELSLHPVLREMSYRLIPSRRRVTELVQELRSLGANGSVANDLLHDAILERQAFSYVRPGGTESEGLYHFVMNRFSRSRFRSSRRYPDFFTKKITPFSGVQFRAEADLDYFCYRYLEAGLGASLLGFGSFAPGALGLARLRSSVGLPVVDFEFVEPLRALVRGSRPWTAGLQGRKVLVVHPFKGTIEEQFSKRETIPGVRDVLPEFALSVIKPPITLNTGPSSGQTFVPWAQSFKLLRDRVLAENFDVAIIGAGAYGAPLADEIARAGRIGVHAAGALQLLFGIRGVRWDADPEMKKFYGSAWIRPSPQEVSEEMKEFDGVGAYH